MRSALASVAHLLFHESTFAERREEGHENVAVPGRLRLGRGQGRENSHALPDLSAPGPKTSSMKALVQNQSSVTTDLGRSVGHAAHYCA